MLKRGCRRYAHAARRVGAPAIQMMGTLAGNIANGESRGRPASCLARLRRAGSSSPPSAGNGVARWSGSTRDTAGLDVGPDELIVGVRVPWPAPARTRRTSRWARAPRSPSRASRWPDCVAVRRRLVRGGPVRGGVGGRDAHSARGRRGCRLRPAAHRGTRRPGAGGRGGRSISPIDDVRGSVEYRRHALGALVERFLLPASAVPDHEAARLRRSPVNGSRVTGSSSSRASALVSQGVSAGLLTRPAPRLPVLRRAACKPRPGKNGSPRSRRAPVCDWPERWIRRCARGSRERPCCFVRCSPPCLGGPPPARRAVAGHDRRDRRHGAWTRPARRLPGADRHADQRRHRVHARTRRPTATGGYRGLLLPLGGYRLTVSLTGFATY